MAGSLVLLAVAVVGASGVTVAAPPGASCPSVEELEAALEGVRRQQGWTVALAPSPDGLTVALRGRDGVVVLQRRMVFAVGDCPAAAPAVAIVVERYLRGLGGPASAAGMRIVAIAAPRIPRLVVSAGAAVAGGVAGGVIAAGARLVGPLAVSLGVMAPARRQEARVGPEGRARTSGTSLEARLLAGSAGRLSAGVSLDGEVAWERGETTGIPAPSVRRRLVFSAGPGVEVGMGAGRWRLALDVGLRRALLGAPFIVEGAGEVLRPAAWRVVAALRIGWVVAP